MYESDYSGSEAVELEEKDVRQAIAKAETGTSSGPDGISMEKRDDVSDDLRAGYMSLIYKKGDQKICKCWAIY